MRKYRHLILFLLILLLLSGCQKRPKESTPAETPTETESTAPETSLPEETAAPESSSAPAESAVPSSGESTAAETAAPAETSVPGSEPAENDPAAQQEHPKARERTWLNDLEIPAYAGEAYILLHDGVPFFDITDSSTEAFELYYDLDELGRCTLAEGIIGRELMPTEKRGNISSVKPTGWHSDKYPQSLVDGQALYNRCHLIAFGLAGENANPYNLVTGTRYFNTAGMNAFENLTIDYIRETGNHVRYRVTPVFSGSNLVCDGAVMEAWSIEDEGDGVAYCIYAYNVQPGIHIDYATGDNWLEGGSGPIEQPTTTAELPTLAEDRDGTFILNIKKKTFHKPDCEGALSMSEKNRQEYTGSYNALILDGYLPCGSCDP